MCPEFGCTWHRADDALYRAKAAGRDRVCSPREPTIRAAEQAFGGQGR